VKVEKMAKNGQMVQNCYPLSPGRAIRRITVPVMDAIANVVLGIPIVMILRRTSLDAQQTQTFASTRMVAQ